MGRTPRRTRNWIWVLLCPALVAGLTVAASRADAQLPANTTPLDGLLGRMVVDPNTAHVFVSLRDSLRDFGEVVVLDFDGHLVKRISGEDGARGLAIVGSSLYVVA